MNYLVIILIVVLIKRSNEGRIFQREFMLTKKTSLCDTYVEPSFSSFFSELTYYKHMFCLPLYKYCHKRAQNGEEGFHIATFGCFWVKNRNVTVWQLSLSLFLISYNYRMRQIRKGSALFLCQVGIRCWKNQDIGTRDGICGGKMGKSKQLPKCHTVTKCTFLNGILLSNIHFSLNFIQNLFFTN